MTGEAVHCTPAEGRVEIDRSHEVLVVDDDAHVRELLVELFRDLGFRVATAVDGRAAITALEREPDRFWLVVTDVAMPGADGMEVLRSARTVNPSLRVVLMTGNASLETAVEAVRAGAFDYVCKPFGFSELEAMISKLGRRPSLKGLRTESAPPAAPTKITAVIDELTRMER